MARTTHRVIFTACLLLAVTVLSGSAVAPEVLTRPPLRVLQLNLCASGIAGCFTGRSVDQAAEVIRAAGPDVVTLNEVCENDVRVLERALARVHGDHVVSMFKAAPDRRTDDATRCRSGQAFGIGLLARVTDPVLGYTTYSGIYPTQDLADPEIRVWLCLYTVGGFYACTTHLANTSSAVALAQCRHLLNISIPALRVRHGYQPTVVGGDLNLRYGAQPDVRPCLPPGYFRLGDDGVQHIVATSDFLVSSFAAIGMGGTTDHPGLFVSITMPGTRAG